MKVLVTGGAGFIGSRLCDVLLEKGNEVIAYDNLSLGQREFLSSALKSDRFQFVEADLLDIDQLNKSMAGIECVWHMAANSDISQGAKYTDIDLRNGTLATYNVLESMRLNSVPKIIFASTSALYGEASVKPTSETYGPLFPISLYGSSKLACEALCSAFSHNFDMQVWMFRFANIVGPRATHGVIYDFISKLKKTPDVLEVLGDGSQKKSYLSVEDCIAGMYYAYENCKDPFQCFNLASQGVTQVSDIAEMVVEAMAPYSKNNARIQYGEGNRGWKGDVPYTWLDGSLLASKGWNAAKDSNEAVRWAVEQIVKERMGS